MPIYDTEDFQIAKSYYIIGNNPLITKPNNLNEKRIKIVVHFLIYAEWKWMSLLIKKNLLKPSILI